MNIFNKAYLLSTISVVYTWITIRMSFAYGWGLLGFRKRYIIWLRVIWGEFNFLFFFSRFDSLKAMSIMIWRTVVSNGRCNDVGYFSRLFYFGIVDLEVTYGSRSSFPLRRLIICQILFIGVWLLSLETNDLQQWLLFCSIVRRAFARKMRKFVKIEVGGVLDECM